MHDGMHYDPIQGQCQGHEPFKVGNPVYIWQKLATEHRFLNYSTIPKFDPTGFLIFGLVCVV